MITRHPSGLAGREAFPGVQVGDLELVDERLVVEAHCEHGLDVVGLRELVGGQEFAEVGEGPALTTAIVRSFVEQHVSSAAGQLGGAGDLHLRRTQSVHRVA